MRFTRDVLIRLCFCLGVSLLWSAPANSQTFAQPTVVPTGNWPAAVYSADVNADGFPDLIYIDQGATPTASTTHILLNDGKGNFKQSAAVATAGDSIAIGDLDGDGKVDIGWLSNTSSTTAGVTTNTIVLSIASGKGDGTFSAATTHSFPTTLYSKPMEFHYLLAGRLHPTGALDLLGGDTANGVVVDLWYSSASPVLITEQIVTPPDGVGPMTLADLNGDGANDLTVNSLTAFTAQTLVGFTGGGFANGGVNHLPPTFTRFSGTSGVHSLLIQDVNGDGRPDLIAEGANGRIDVFPGNGDATFSSTSAGGTGTLDGRTGNGGHLIALADFNHDNLPDALAATPIGVSSLLGNGTAYLGLQGIYNAGPGHTSYAVADFNHDGNLDLALDSPEGIAILYGNADGSFRTPQAFAAGLPAMSGATGVFTKSGQTDAVVSTGPTQAQFLRGNGDGTFTYQGSPSAPVPTTSAPGPAGLWSVVRAGDFFADGFPAISLTADGPTALLPSSGSGFIIQRGNDNGTFQSPVGPNVAVANPGCTGGADLLYGATILDNITGTGSPSVINRDRGSLRILTTNPVMPAVPTLSQAYPDATCTQTHNLVATGAILPRPPGSLYFADIIAQSGSSFLVYLNDGTGHYAQPLGDLSVDGSLTTPGQLTAPQLSSTFGGISPTLGFPAFPGSIAIADLDRDGNSDIIISYANLSANLQAPSAAAPNYIYIWFGSGGGKFLTSAKHPVNPVRLTPSRNFYQVAAIQTRPLGAIPDLVLSDGYILSVQLGAGDGTFGPETHYLAGQGINTISPTFGPLRSHSGPSDLVIANGGAVLTNPVANHETLATNPDVNTGGITVLLNTASSLATPTGTVTAQPEPSIYGSTFTLYATLDASTGTLFPSGTVSFTIDGVLSGTATLVNGIASVVIPTGNAIAVGSHTVTAVYSGDSTYSAATFSGVHTVAAPVGYSVVASPEPSTYGSAFTITATLPGPGNFVFSIDGTSIGTVTTSTANTATIVGPTTLAVGTHALAVTWTAAQSALALIVKGSHTVVQSTTSLTLALCVDPPGSAFPCGNPLTATPVVSPVTMYYGQTLDGDANESSTILTGTINFLANGIIFCTINANLQAGANACPPNAGNFQAGSFVVQATYSGDANNTAASSNTVNVTVFKDLTTATASASVATAVFGTPVTFTGQVTGNFAIPVGPIVFYDGTSPIGTGTLDLTGRATLTSSTLAIGTHAVSITYAGNANFNPTASPAVTVIITAPAPPGPQSFTLTVTPSPITLGVGRTGILLVTVTAINGFSQPVALTCSGLPSETGCTFLASTITGSGTTTLQFATSAPHDCGDPSHPYFLGTNRSGPPKAFYAGLVLLLAGLAGTRRRLRTRLNGTLLLLALTLIGLSALSGCGHCTDLGTLPGKYTFTVTGTAASETQSQTVLVTMVD